MKDVIILKCQWFSRWYDAHNVLDLLGNHGRLCQLSMVLRKSLLIVENNKQMVLPSASVKFLCCLCQKSTSFTKANVS